jgi:hypothetical protein
MGKTYAGVSDSDSECDVREVHGEWMYDRVAERPVEETCDIDPRGSIKSVVDGESESRRGHTINGARNRNRCQQRLVYTLATRTTKRV